jgi:hypothetical protein
LAGLKRASRFFEVRPSPIQGRGGFATRRIPRGTRIVEYTGERITHAEADARYDDARGPRHHTFLFTVDRETVVDAAVGGNAARFINHSCEPNCRPVIEGGRVYIVVARDIAPGEELSYDYAYTREGGTDEQREERYSCGCGARRCRGTMLSPRRAGRRGSSDV